MFVGREKELDLINNELQKKSSSIMIYGKRKVGKTTLILEALKNDLSSTIYFECTKAPLIDNINGFINELVNAKLMTSFIPFQTFQDIFKYLNNLNQTINIIIDEYPYLKTFEKHETVDSIFQNIVDNYLTNIRLFISGSHIGMMQDLLEEKNALYGRWKLVIKLEELDYKQASCFYQNLSPYEKVAYFSIFGGSPYINNFINPNKNLAFNIKNTILNEYSPVFTYADNVLLTDFTGATGVQRVLSTISNGKKKYKEIEDNLHMNKTGLLSKQLNALLSMSLITKTYPINKPNDSKKVHYEINDNLMRFYYAYIYKNKSALKMIGPDAFFKEYIEPTLKFFIAKRFESIARSYFSLQIRSGKLQGITNVGTYYYDNSKTKTNGEFDVVLQRHDLYDVYEVKYEINPMSKAEIEKEIKQMQIIPYLQITDIGFISINGFQIQTNQYKLLTGEDLYK